MILTFELLIYCIVLGGLYLLVFDLIWNMLERIVPIFQGFPKELIEPRSGSLFLYVWLAELIFFVFVPAVIYNWFFSVLPLSGIKGGLSVAMFVFVIGIAPFAMIVLFRIKLPAVFILYHTLGILLKITGTIAIIGHLYSM